MPFLALCRPVFAHQMPVLQNNRKWPDTGVTNGEYGLISGRLPSSVRQKPVMSRYFQKIPCSQVRDQFANDCAHSSLFSQPVAVSDLSGSGRSQSRHWKACRPLPACGGDRIMKAPQWGQIGRRSAHATIFAPVPSLVNSKKCALRGTMYYGGSGLKGGTQRPAPGDSCREFHPLAI